MLQLLLLISAPWLVLLAIHVWRDGRGKKRNSKSLCYACGGSLFYQGGPRVVSHSRGGSFLYCGYCAKLQGLLLNIALITSGIALIGFFVIKAL